MARSPRVRNRTHSPLNGSRITQLLDGTDTVLFQTTTNVVVAKVSDSCSDAVGRPVVDSALEIRGNSGSLKISGYLIAGPKSATHTKIQFNDDYSQTFVSQHVSTVSPPAGWFLDLVAGTNPSRPVVTPPTLAQDLIELPSMIRDVGRLLTRSKASMSPKELANYYLAVQFGWRPLIDDVLKLLDLQQAIQKRMAELKKLQQGGMRRRLSFGDSSSNAKSTTPYGSGVNTVTVIRSTDTKVRKWATIHWYPDPSWENPRPDDARNYLLARSIVTGLTPEGMAKGLWDVIPWTWLIGWFTNVGKLILANSNTVPASHGTGCFMISSVETSRLSTSKTGMIDDHVTVSGEQTRKHLRRYVSGSITPGFNVPFVDTFRASIVASLFAQRFTR